jgi:lactate dehydrogenase-like 2-hydroxyacid dehydrogenase
MKVLVAYNFMRDGFRELESRYDVTFPESSAFSYEEILELIPEYDILCSMFDTPVDKSLIDKAINLKLVANYAVGYDNIDVDYAVSRGITVANTPEPVIAPTANLALGLMLDIARRVSECDRNLRTRERTESVSLVHHLGVDLSGCTLGIVGMGRIGKALCKRAKACGMNVIYHNRRQLDIDVETELGVIYYPFEELLAQADFVSLHVPLSDATRHIIDTNALNTMKSSSFLINTGRGPLVDEFALAAALREHRIAGAALDVFEFGDYPIPELLDLENVVMTPHIGTQTMKARYEMLQAVCNNVIGFVEKDRPVYRVLHK